MAINFKSLVESLHTAYTDFRKVWKNHSKGFSKSEPKEVTKSREEFHVAFDNLFSVLWKYEIGLENKDKHSIDRILDFIEVEQTTFRIGYARQRFFRRLKRTPLDETQKHRIKNIGLSYCVSEDYKREYRDLIRLLIKIADKEFISKIDKIKSESFGVVKFKSKLMLDTILHHRIDLRNE